MLPAVSIFFFFALQVVWLSCSLAFPQMLKQNLQPKLEGKKLVTCKYYFFNAHFRVRPHLQDPCVWEGFIIIITVVVHFPGD